MNFKSKDFEFSIAPRALIAIILIVCALLGFDVPLR